MRNEPLIFCVSGTPGPAGSKTAFPHPVTGKKIYVNDSKAGTAWMKQVKKQVAAQYRGPLLTGAISLAVLFRMPRPKYHFGTGRNAGRIKPQYREVPHTVKPDRTKLLRATEDAMTGIVWVDDKQVVTGPTAKRYVDPDEKPGAWIRVREI